jgi:hypothetical protein
MKWLPLAIITGLTVGLLLLAGTAEGKATRISFTHADYCMLTSLGTYWYADDTIHVRGLTLECDQQADIPQLIGTAYGVINADLDATGSGPIRWTWRMETEGGGWEGVSQGKVTAFLTPGQSGTFRSVGHGTGDYEGQQYFADGVPGSVLTATGYILVP